MVCLLLTLVIVSAVAFVVVEEDKVVFGPNEAIYYEGGATETDARRLGSFLQESGFFDGTMNADVWLAKTSKEGLTTGFAVSFVMMDGV